MLLSKIYSVALRAIGLVARFGLVAYLAKVLTLEEFGYFGILVAAIYMAPSVFGLGLHYRANRDLVLADVNDVANTILAKAAVVVMLIPVFVVGATGLSYFFRHEHWLQGWFGALEWLIVTLALLEVVLNDAHLALLSKALLTQANTLSFIRTTAWIPPMVVCFQLGFSPPTLEPVMGFWLGGQVFALLLFLVLSRSWGWGRNIRFFKRLRSLFDEFRAVSLPVYFSDLASVGASYGDRFLVAGILDVRAVGVYTFFWSIANGISQLLNVGLVQPALSTFVKIHADQGRNGLYKKLRRSMLNAGALLLAVAPFGYLGGVVLTDFMKKVEFRNDVLILAILIAGASIKVLGDLSGYALYAARDDRRLFLANMLGFLVAITSCYFLASAFGLYGVAFAYLLGSAAVFGMKYSIFKSGNRLLK